MKRTWPHHSPKCNVDEFSGSFVKISSPTSTLTSMENIPTIEYTNDTPPSTSFKSMACNYINESRYETCFRLLINKSPAAKQAMTNVMSSIIKKEIHNGIANSYPQSMVGNLTSPEDLASFNWKKVHDEMSTNMPMLTTLMCAAMPSISTIKRRVMKGTKKHKR